MKLASGEEVADYKVEIYMPRERSVMKDNYLALISTWVSGGQANDDCDQGMFWCLDAAWVTQPGAFAEVAKMIRSKETGDRGCGHLIPPDNVQAKIARCPHCLRTWNPKQMTQLLPFRGSMVDLVTLLEHFYFALNTSVDFSLKFDREKNMRILVADAQELRAFKAKERLNDAPLKIDQVIYPMKNLRKDLLTGATLSGRLKAFLTA